MILPHWVLRRQHGNQALRPSIHVVQVTGAGKTSLTGIWELSQQGLSPQRRLWQPVTSTVHVTKPVTLPPTAHWKAA